MIKIEESRTAELNADADFIYNRFDLIYPDNYSFLTMHEDGVKKQTLALHIEDRKAELGLWLVDLHENESKALCEYVFSHYEADTIVYRNCLHKITEFPSTWGSKNHWKVEIPATTDELDYMLSAKSRSTIRRKKRIAEESLGGYEIKQFSAYDVPKEIISTYFEFKKSGYGIDYGMTPEQYLETYHVTNIYTLEAVESVKAILFTCEQGRNIYLENLTYDPEYSKLSLGSILYDEVLRIIVGKGLSNFYLGYGKQQYKAMYGAVEQDVFSGTVYKNRYLYFRRVALPGLRNKCVSFAKRILRKLDIFNLISKLK